MQDAINAVWLGVGVCPLGRVHHLTARHFFSVANSFTGAFHCPVATDFCRFETISGVKYSEFVAWQVWILLGIFIGIPGLIFLTCLFPCLREPFVRRLKSW